MEKKSLIILQSDLNNHIDIANQILSIISSQATSLGRFEIIDRNLVTEILAEQKFQLSGMINDENIIEIGNMASADEALILKIIQFNQKGVPKEKDEENDENDEDEKSTLFSWLVKTVVTEAIDNIKKGVFSGETLTKLFLKEPLFPPTFSQLISVGEQTGQLDEMFNSVAMYYEEEFDNAVDNMSSLIEPIMIVFMGLMIGGLMIAMYSPIFNVGALIG